MDHLEEAGFLAFDGVYHTIGDEAETQFGRRHFMALSSVFTSSPDFEVLHGSKPLGTLDWLSLAYQDGERRHPVILAGRTWDIGEIDWKRRKVYVTPSAAQGKARWDGSGRGLSFELARENRQILLSDVQSPRWTRRAVGQLSEEREQRRHSAEALGRFVHDAGDDRLRWFTFAGSPLNELVGVYLRTRTGGQVTWDDFCLSLPGSMDVQKVRDLVIELLASPDIVTMIPPSAELLENLKFAECLPPLLAHRAVLGRIRLEMLTADTLLGTPSAVGVP